MLNITFAMRRSGLKTRLQALHSAVGDAIAYVRADKGVRYGNVMENLGRIGNAGYGRISLLSQPKTGTETVSK